MDIKLLLFSNDSNLLGYLSIIECRSFNSIKIPRFLFISFFSALNFSSNLTTLSVKKEDLERFSKKLASKPISLIFKKDRTMSKVTTVPDKHAIEKTVSFLKFFFYNELFNVFIVF